nr:hypothetical protein [Sphingobium sp. CCH11-B1]
MRVGEKGVGAIERVSGAVVGQGYRFRRAEAAHVRPCPERLLIDIIADLKHDIDILRRHIGICAEPALLPMLAGGKRQPQLPYMRVDRHGPADPACRSAKMETVEIGPPGGKALYLQMDRTATSDRRRDPAGANDPAEIVVECDLESRRAVLLRSHYPRPEHEAVVRRFARRNAQRKGVT